MCNLRYYDCHSGQDTQMRVGLDSEKSIFSEKMRKDAKRGGNLGKDVIRYGKSVYDTIKYDCFSGKKIW